VRLDYQSIGSGGGLKQVMARAVTFGASDAALPGADLSQKDLAQFPTVLGAVVVVVSLDGVQPGELTLDGPTLARIYLGEITRWDDPAIARLNPALKLPSADIAVLHRGDGSGTTYTFTSYLSKVSPDWKRRVGSSTFLEWPVGQGAKGCEGISNLMGQTKGGIGYVEYAYALQNKLAYTRLVNRQGNAVAPSPQTIQAAAASADWTGTPGFGLVLTDQPGADSWPITATTFVLMPRKPPNAREAAAALAFFDWGYTKGGPSAEQLQYVPLPAGVIGMITKSWSEITADGKPVFPAD
jgi:phosphate transport system substrate-binding protein